MVEAGNDGGVAEPIKIESIQDLGFQFPLLANQLVSPVKIFK